MISRVIAKSKESLERGGSLTEPMNGHWAFPPLIPHMIAIGEQTGTLDSMLVESCRFLRERSGSGDRSVESVNRANHDYAVSWISWDYCLAIMMPMFEMFNNIDGM